MTNEEAITYIKQHCYGEWCEDEWREAMDAAIKALEQNPCQDAISRQAAIDAADKIIERDTSGNNDVVKAMTAWKMYVEALPSVQLERKSRLVEEIEGKTPEETYDFLSWLMVDYGLQFTDTRQAVIEWLRGEQDE